MRVALFITCFNDTLFPRHGQGGGGACSSGSATRSTSPRSRPAAGRCTTTPATSARRSRWSGTSSRSSRDAEVVVSPSASCVGMVHDLYPRLAALAGDAGLAREVAGADPAGASSSPSSWSTGSASRTWAPYFPHRVTFHPTCHSQRMLRVGDAPQRLLAAVRGIDLVELPARRGVLRLRRHLRGEERRHLDGDALGQDPLRARHRRRVLRGGRQLVPHAHRRRAAPPARRRAPDPPRRDPGEPDGE